MDQERRARILAQIREFAAAARADEPANDNIIAEPRRRRRIWLYIIIYLLGAATWAGASYVTTTKQTIAQLRMQNATLENAALRVGTGNIKVLPDPPPYHSSF